MLDEVREVYHAAVEKWGMSAQILMAIEEMSELTTVLCHALRGRSSISDSQLADELADVGIMIEQITAMYGIEDVVENRRVYKIDRVRERLRGQ